MLNKALLPITLSLVCLLLVPLASQAQISVSRSVVEFSKSEKVQDVEVFNGGKHKVYLDMKAAEIIAPESSDPQRLELSDPRTAPLLITPQQVMVPPGERRRIRVVLREYAKDKDRVFRLAVKPYAGSVSIDTQSDNTKASAIKVLVGYDLLLLSRPENALADMKVKRAQNTIEFVNEGNTNVLLRRIEQCDVEGLQCVELPANRLYAGERYSLELPLKGAEGEFPVTVWKAVGLENSKSVY